MIINAGYWDPGGTSISNGLTFDGTQWYQNSRFIDKQDTGNRLTAGSGDPGFYTTLFYYENGTTKLHNTGTLTRQIILNMLSSNGSNLLFAISGTIPSGTVYNGEVLNRSNPNQARYFNNVVDTGVNLRSMIGVTANGSIIFLTADSGKTNDHGQGIRGGVSVDEGAEILRSMGAVNIINMDGSGSTQMFLRDKGGVLHPPFDGPANAPYHRDVGSVFLVW
jgi:hypothetical protein